MSNVASKQPEVGEIWIWHNDLILISNQKAPNGQPLGVCIKGDFYGSAGPVTPDMQSYGFPNLAAAKKAKLL